MDIPKGYSLVSFNGKWFPTKDGRRLKMGKRFAESKADALRVAVDEDAKERARAKPTER